MNPEDWPADGSAISFAALADPICAAIRFAYKLERRNDGLDIPWTGPEIGAAEQVNCHPAHHQLRAETLAESLDDQGRDALTEIVALAIRLGLEQGRRITKTDIEYRALLRKIEIIKAIIAD